MAEVKIFVPDDWVGGSEESYGLRQGFVQRWARRMRRDWLSAAGFSGHCGLFGLSLDFVAQTIE